MAIRLTIIPPNMAANDFEETWRTHRQQIMAICLRLMRDSTRADDLFQEVALRAWRGWATFRGDASFTTWIYQIAQRAAATLGRRRSREQRVMQSLTPVESAPPTAEISSESKLAVLAALARAADEKWLDQQEAEVLRRRYELDAAADWNAVAAQLGITPGHAAVIHCRAVPKFRMYLFRFRKQLLGGASAIHEAFQHARAELSMDEAKVFQVMVIDEKQEPPFRKWETELRAACGKVVRYLAAP